MSHADDTCRPALADSDLEAARLAEECARSALASSENSLVALERAEGSLLASEQRMAEVSAAAVVAAGEATEARLRATEIESEFRALEERVVEALRLRAERATSGGDGLGAASGPADERASSDLGPPSAAAGEPSEASADFDRRWSAFERRANRVIEQLRALEPGELTVRGPTKTRSSLAGHVTS